MITSIITKYLIYLLVVIILIVTVAVFYVAPIYLIIKIIKRFSISKEEQDSNIPKLYNKRQFMTGYETSFYNKIKDLETEYEIVPQINLATIIEKVDSKYRNELFRNIDFGIFDKDYKNLLLLIEINDNTHNQKHRQIRDKKVKSICNEAGINLITFYTNYANEKSYVINRIKNEIEKSTNNDKKSTDKHQS